MTTPPSALQLFLAEQDVRCPGCDYNLRGLFSPQCPECSTPIRLALDLEALDRPHAGPGTLALATGALILTGLATGIQAVLLGAYFVGVRGQVSGMPWLVLATYLVPFAASIFALGSLGKARTRPARRLWMVRSALTIAVIAQSAQLLIIICKLARIGF